MAGPFRGTDLRIPIFMFLGLLAFIHYATCGRLEPGKEKFILATSNYSKGMPVFAIRAIKKSMFKNTSVKITITDEKVFCNTSFAVAWELRYTRCAQLYTAKSEDLFIQDLMMDPSFMYSVEPEISVMRNGTDFYTCSDVTSSAIHPQFPPSNATTCYVPRKSPQHANCKEGNVWGADPNVDAGTGDGGETDTGDGGGTGTGVGGDADTGDNGDTGTDDSGDAGTDDDGDTQGTDDDGDAGADDNGGAGSPDGSRRRKRDNQPSSPEDPNKPPSPEDPNKPPSPNDPNKPPSPEDPNKPPSPNDPNKPPSPEDPDKPASPKDSDKNMVARTPTTGSYLLMLNISTEDIAGGVSFQVTVDMKGPYGYLSATQYPLLKFYGVMCGVYTLFGFTWLFLLCRQYQDLLGIQIWIGVVILLGLVEKAAFYGEFEHMNNKGTESNTGILLAELVSCVKRTLARLLVVIVSIGYGITRPRLGTDLNYIMAAGLLYMTLSSAEAIMRVSESYEHSMVAVLPLSVLEAILVWWILRNLVDTTRTLRLRNNETKLWLYRHFTNTLLLCIIFSIIFSIWSMKTHRFTECVEKHYELWLDDAFWHILFCVILFVVMILFRPSANNQRYAYSPLLDEEQDDEESKEPMLSEAYDGMKMRNLKKDNPQNAVKDIADDLKWVEDNIPAAIADSALAIMDDSEEELVTNLERSKMD